MQNWTDYYKVLQVHNLAEYEVIDSAYKRLVRKYHPDANKALDAEAKIKQINEAYEILRNPHKRKEYDGLWIQVQSKKIYREQRTKEHIDAKSIGPAQETLTRYFKYIKNEDFKSAYRLISSTDKRKISLEDFLSWRNTVVKIFRLHEFECRASTLGRDIQLDGTTYKEALDFLVMTVEHNAIMDRSEKDILIKKLVLEREGWRVYVGHNDVAPLISRFEELTDLLTAKSVMHEMVEAYSNKDPLTGLLNNKGFVEVAEKEIWRYNRYGNDFSLMMIDLNCGNVQGKRQEKAIISASRILENSLRKLDSIGRWGNAGFIVLMPETDLALGVKAAARVRDAIALDKTLSIGLDQFSGSLGDTVETLHQLINVAKKHGLNAIVTPCGIHDN